MDERPVVYFMSKLHYQREKRNKKNVTDSICKKLLFNSSPLVNSHCPMNL